MSKTLLYRLFKAGAIPEEHRRTIENEGMILYDEGVAGSITVKNYRAPGRYSAWRRNWFSGAIVLTHQHLLCFCYSRVMVGLPWNEITQKGMEFYLEKDDVLCIQYDAGAFTEKASGETVLRYRTPMAFQLHAKIIELLVN